MARRKKAPPEPPRYPIRGGRDSKSNLKPAGYEAGDVHHCMDEAHRLAECAVVDVGRPFQFHVPSNGQGPSGFVFDGLTGENATPWTASQVLAAARYQMFGFTIA